MECDENSSFLANRNLMVRSPQKSTQSRRVPFSQCGSPLVAVQNLTNYTSQQSLIDVSVRSSVELLNLPKNEENLPCENEQFNSAFADQSMTSLQELELLSIAETLSFTHSEAETSSEELDLPHGSALDREVQQDSREPIHSTHATESDPEQPLETLADCVSDPASSAVTEIANMLQSIGSKVDATWVSFHTLASFTPDSRCSEADVKANAAASHRPSVEAVVVAATKESRGSSEANPTVDIVVHGDLATRTLACRAWTTLVRNDSQLLSFVLHAQQLLSAFASSNLDETECDQSFGWLDSKLSRESERVISMMIRPALLQRGSNLGRKSDEATGRLFNIFHFLIARNFGKRDHTVDNLLFNNADDVIGEKFTLIRNLGDLSMKNLRQISRMDFFGYNNVVEALSALNFSKDEQQLIWKTCSAILHLGNVDDQVLPRVAELLDIDSTVLRETLLSSESQLEFAAHLYQELYTWIVCRINARFTILLSTQNSASSLEEFNVRIFDCSSVTNIPVVALETVCFIPADVLTSFVSASANDSTISMHELLARCDNARYVIYCLGSRWQSPSEGYFKPASSIAKLNWQYSKHVLEGSFPMVSQGNAEAFTRYAVLESGLSSRFVVEEGQWELLLVSELHCVLKEMKDALQLSQQGPDVYSVHSMSGAESLVADIKRAISQLTDFTVRAKEATQSVALLDGYSKLLEAAELDLAVKRLLNGNTHDDTKSFDLRIALRVLKRALTDPRTINASPFLALSLKEIQSRLRLVLQKAKIQVDSSVFKQVLLKDSAFTQQDLPLLLRKESKDIELHSLLEYIFSFSKSDDDAFQRAKTSAEMAMALKSGSSSKKKAHAAYIVRMVEMLPGSFRLEDFIQQRQVDLGLEPVSRSVHAVATMLKAAQLVARVPLIATLKSSANTKLATHTPVRPTTIRRPVLSFAKSWKRNDARSAALTPENKVELRRENYRMWKLISDTEEFGARFWRLFNSVCDGLRDDANSMALIVFKKNLCEMFTYLNASHPNDILSNEDFKNHILLCIIEMCESCPWTDNSGTLSKSAVNRLAFLAYALFVFGGGSVEIVPYLWRWVLSLPSLTEILKSVLQGFLFETHPLFDECNEAPEGSRIGSDKVDQVWAAVTGTSSVGAGVKQANLVADPLSVMERVKQVATVAAAQAMMRKEAPELAEKAPVSSNGTEDMSEDTVSVISSKLSSPSAAAKRSFSKASESSGLIDDDEEAETTVIVDPAARPMTEEERQAWDRAERKRKHQDEWKATHVNCAVLYDYADPDGEELYLSVKAGEIVWIPLQPSGKKSALSQSKEWIWVERYVGEDQDRSRLVDENGRSFRTEGYVPFKYVGFPGYE